MQTRKKQFPFYPLFGQLSYYKNFCIFFICLSFIILFYNDLSNETVFRKNASYQRWDEARKAWGVVVNNSRTIARQTSAWIKYSDLPFDEKQRLLNRIRDTIWAFPRALARHLLSEREDEENYCQAVREQLDEPFASELIRWKRHRPSRALFEMSNAINELPLEMYRRIAIDESVSHLCDAMGGCDRVRLEETRMIIGIMRVCTLVGLNTGSYHFSFAIYFRSTHHPFHPCILGIQHDF